MQQLPEGGHALADGLRIGDPATGPGEEDGQRHDDSVVVVALQQGRRGAQLSAGNGDPVRLHFGLNAAFGQLLHHGGAPVAFLEPQPGGVREYRTVTGRCHRHQDGAQIRAVLNGDDRGGTAQQGEEGLPDPVALAGIRGKALRDHPATQQVEGAEEGGSGLISLDGERSAGPAALPAGNPELPVGDPLDFHTEG